MTVSLLLLSLIISASPLDGLILDRVAARIENEIILFSDLTQKVELLTGDRVEYNEKDPKIAKLYQNVLNELIEDRLIMLELKKSGQDVTDSEVKATIDDIMKQRGLTQSEFDKLLSNEGLTFERYREEMRRQVRKNKFMALKVRQRVRITDEDAKLFYQQEFSSQRQGNNYDISMIFVSSINRNKGDPSPEERIKTIKRLLSEGKDFAEVAKEYSDDPSRASGGQIGNVQKGKIREDFEKVIFELKENQISEPISTREGYYIFKVNKISDSDIKSFEEAKEDIKRMLFEKEMMKQYSYMMDSLKKKYTIYINLK